MKVIFCVYLFFTCCCFNFSLLLSSSVSLLSLSPSLAIWWGPTHLSSTADLGYFSRKWLAKPVYVFLLLFLGCFVLVSHPLLSFFPWPLIFYIISFICFPDAPLIPSSSFFSWENKQNSRHKMSGKSWCDFLQCFIHMSNSCAWKWL